jgi:drug/metabolite transporter (DMT)-like permease
VHISYVKKHTLYVAVCRLAGGRVPVLQLCIIRSSISFCTSIAAGTASGIKPLFGHREHFPLLFLRGFFGTLAISTSYLALLSLPLGDAVTIAQVRVFFNIAVLLVLRRLHSQRLRGSARPALGWCSGHITCVI